MGSDQTGCHCQRTGHFTAVFEEVSSSVHQACWDIFPSLLLGKELTVPVMFSLTQPPPTAAAAHPLLGFTVNIPNSMLLLLRASPLCRWAQSPHVPGGLHTWPAVCCSRHGSSRGAGVLGQLQPQPPGDTAGPSAGTFTSSHSWYSPTCLLRGQLAASGRAASMTGSLSDGVQVTLGCRGCSTASQDSPAHQEPLQDFSISFKHSQA